MRKHNVKYLVHTSDFMVVVGLYDCHYVTERSTESGPEPAGGYVFIHLAWIFAVNWFFDLADYFHFGSFAETKLKGELTARHSNKEPMQNGIIALVR